MDFGRSIDRSIEREREREGEREKERERERERVTLRLSPVQFFLILDLHKAGVHLVTYVL